MLIWFSMLIPVVVGLVLYFGWHHKMIWWEFFIPLVVSLLFVVGTKAIVEHSQVTSKEYWGSLITKASYYEAWDEYIKKTCSRQNCSGSGKNRSCTTVYYDCSYVDYHSEYWKINTTNGESMTIPKSYYKEIVKKFGNETFKDLRRNYHRRDGDMYYSTWGSDRAKAIPVTTNHTYENRVKVAEQSVFNFREVDSTIVKQYKLKEYPSTSYYKHRVVLGDHSRDGHIGNEKIGIVNGLLGAKKQVKIFVNVFKDQPIDAGQYQEHYWKGGNKNEFVVNVGITKDRKVQWCHVFSWTRSENLKAEVKTFVQNQGTLSIEKLADYLEIEINKQFERRSFKEFEYLTVEPPLGAVIFAFLMTLAINIGMSVWIIKNEFE